MKSIVTGASGFIGTRLVKQLESEEDEVIALNSNDGDLSICDIEDIVDFSEKYDRIFHLAAKTFVPNSWDFPEEFIQSNVLSTLNVLNSCKRNNIPMIFLSAYIYGNQKELPISESAIIQPSNPYAQSKYLCEELCRYYFREFAIDITVLRPFNIYGPNQKSHFLLPEIIEQAGKGNIINVDSFNPRRDYLYIDDLIDAIILASKNISKYQIYNIGSGYSISVLELIQSVERILGSSFEITERQKDRVNEIDDVVADIQSVEENLSWQPKTTLEDGLRKTLTEHGLC